MAYSDFGTHTTAGHTPLHTDTHTFQADNGPITLPDSTYIRDADFSRDGADLVLQGPHGTATIEGYFAQETPPHLTSPDGATLTPALVESFTKSAPEYAANTTASDESPVGAVQEFSGQATVTHSDGTVEHVAKGTAIYQGDIVETSADGAVNIHFNDDTSFAVSENAKLAIDEYVYDPETESGAQNFSVLKGVFVFTSGLIGRDDPDDVKIDTPTGSIGIRGTVIAGDVNAGQITVLEGAIVVRDLAGHEMTLATQYETAKIVPGEGVHNMGQISAHDLSSRFSSISDVAPDLFSSVNDSAAEQKNADPAHATENGESKDPAPEQTPDTPADKQEKFDANGTVDKNGDHQVDGTLSHQPAQDGPAGAEPAKPALPPIGPQGMLGTDPMTGGQAMMNGMPQIGHGMGLSPQGMAGTLPPPNGGAFFDMGPQPLASAVNTVLADGTHLPLPPLNILPPPPFLNGDTTGTNFVDHAPIHIKTTGVANMIQNSNLAPDVYFKAAEGHEWSYGFHNEFVNLDSDHGDALHYQLSTTTLGALADTVTAGGSWTFNTANGKLDITFGTVATTQTFQIEIQALDNAGNSSGFHNYTFTVFDTPTDIPASVLSASNTLYADLSAPSNNAITVIGSNNTLFMGQGNDTISSLSGNGNIINLGKGDNTVTITSGTDNTIVGGINHDIYNPSVAQNQFFGMDGDDIVKINLASTSLMSALNTTGNNGILMDTGDSAFKYGAIIKALNANYTYTDSTTAFGDTLKLTGTGGHSIDFQAIDNNYLRGIERIDATSAGLNATVTVNYNDVLNMTDYKNTLIFRVDSGDSLVFDNTDGKFSAFTKLADNVVVDDGYEGTATNVNFDIYTDGNVTLLVQENGATVTGLPV